MKLTQKELVEIYNKLKLILRKYEPPFTPKWNLDSKYDLWSEKSIIVNGKNKSEIWFAGLIIQSSYVGFYFMPVYSIDEAKELLPQNLIELLKGKSCFHIKKLTPELENSINKALEIGYKLYKERGWI